MVTRHKGIKTESAFSLAMFRWVNKIIEFMEVVRQMNQIGIVEFEGKIERLRQYKNQIEHLLTARRQPPEGTFCMFAELRAQRQVAEEIAQISESYYSSDFDAFSVTDAALEEEEKVDSSSTKSMMAAACLTADDITESQNNISPAVLLDDK